MNRNVILTPIARNPRPVREDNGRQLPDSWREFAEQLLTTIMGDPWMWNDTPSNRAQVGDLFGFVHNDSHVNYHIVTEIHPFTERLPNWGANIGQRNRNVLYLSPEIGRHEWNEWLECGGYNLRRTMYVTRQNLKQNLFILF